MSVWVKNNKKNRPQVKGEYVCYYEGDDDWDVLEWDGIRFLWCGQKTIQPSHWMMMSSPEKEKE